MQNMPMNSIIKKNVCAECTSVKKKGERYEKKKHESIQFAFGSQHDCSTVSRLFTAFRTYRSTCGSQ